MKKAELEAMISFYERIIGGSDAEYGFKIQPVSEDELIQTLIAGDGKSRFTPCDIEEKAGVVIGYQKEGALAIDYRFMVMFDNTESIDSMIEALKSAKRILRQRDPQ